MKIIKVVCDVEGCNSPGGYSVDCCDGYQVSDDYGVYKKFEKPRHSKKDFCKPHYIEWCKKTYKIMRFVEK